MLKNYHVKSNLEKALAQLELHFVDWPWKCKKEVFSQNYTDFLFYGHKIRNNVLVGFHYENEEIELSIWLFDEKSDNAMHSWWHSPSGNEGPDFQSKVKFSKENFTEAALNYLNLHCFGYQ